MPELGVAVIGLGLGRHFVRALADSDRVGRLTICDPDARRVAEVRSAFPLVAGAYADVDALLSTERPDAVAIVTPDHLHRPHAEKCLQAGCAVLLTKPLATNLTDGAAIVRAADCPGRIFMVAHERRFRSRIRAIKRLLVTGALGEVVHLRVDTIQDKRGQFERSPWYASAEAGRSALVGSGIHEVDLLRHLVGRPIESVAAFGNRIGPLEFPKDTTTCALFRFEGGAVGQVTVTYQAHWPASGAVDDAFRLVGTKGIVVGNTYATDGMSDWAKLPVDESEIATGVEGCVTAFLRSVLDGDAVPVDGREAFASLAACVAADEAAATGRHAVPSPFAQ